MGIGILSPTFILVFKIQYGEIYIIHRQDICRSQRNLKSNMERFISPCEPLEPFLIVI